MVVLRLVSLKALANHRVDSIVFERQIEGTIPLYSSIVQHLDPWAVVSVHKIAPRQRRLYLYSCVCLLHRTPRPLLQKSPLRTRGILTQQI